MRALGAIAVVVCAALAAAGCGSSGKPAATPPPPPTTSAATSSTSGTTTATTPVATVTLTATPAPSQGTTTAPAPKPKPKPKPAPAPAPVTTAVVTTATAPPPTSTESQVVQQSVCPTEQEPGILANFGHRRTRSQAQVLADEAAKSGFQGLVVERRSCTDFAVVLRGLTTMHQASAFEREARGAGFPVTLECRSHPFEGGLTAVFGHRPTRRAAVVLRNRAAASGFKGLLVVQDRCDDWEVVLYGATTATQRRQLAAEARTVGFAITFEPG